MSSNIKELSTLKGIYYIKQEGNYLNVYLDKEAKRTIKYRINIPLFYDIALYTTERCSYKNVILKFYDMLTKENIKGLFTSRKSLENASQSVGKPGGRIAFLLGLFCRYYGTQPRNVNFVWSICENCNNYSKCGTLKKCGDNYGCGEGVTRPLEPNFKIKSIPEIREKIKKEKLTLPDI